ncbi:MAG: hypothetical protein GY771_17310, partial [bacterium]|nr:hypothetical protein [bacterium]
MRFLISILGAFGISAALTPIIILLGRKLRLFVERGQAGDRAKVPGYGGVAVFIAVTVLYIAFSVYGYATGEDFVPRLLALVGAGA